MKKQDSKNKMENKCERKRVNRFVCIRMQLGSGTLHFASRTLHCCSRILKWFIDVKIMKSVCCAESQLYPHSDTNSLNFNCNSGSVFFCFRSFCMINFHFIRSLQNEWFQCWFFFPLYFICYLDFASSKSQTNKTMNKSNKNVVEKVFSIKQCKSKWTNSFEDVILFSPPFMFSNKNNFKAALWIDCKNVPVW